MHIAVQSVLLPILLGAGAQTIVCENPCIHFLLFHKASELMMMMIESFLPKAG